MAAVTEGEDGGYGTAAAAEAASTAAIAGGEGVGEGPVLMMRQDSTEAALEGGEKVEERTSNSASRSVLW